MKLFGRNISLGTIAFLVLATLVCLTLAINASKKRKKHKQPWPANEPALPERGADGHTGIYIDDQGRVGINTLTPKQELTLAHDNHPVLRMAATGEGLADWEMAGGAVDGGLVIRGGLDAVGTGLPDLLRFNTNGTLWLANQAGFGEKPVCDRSNEGTLFYSRTNNQQGALYLCDGSQWNPLSATSQVKPDQTALSQQLASQQKLIEQLEKRVSQLEQKP